MKSILIIFLIFILNLYLPSVRAEMRPIPHKDLLKMADLVVEGATVSS